MAQIDELRKQYSKNNLAMLMAQCNWYLLADKKYACNTARMLTVLEDANLLNLAEEYGFIEKQIEISELGTCIIASGDLVEKIKRNSKITNVSEISSEPFSRLISLMDEKGRFNGL